MGRTRSCRLLASAVAALAAGVVIFGGGSVAHADVNELTCVPLPLGGQLCTGIEVSEPDSYAWANIVGVLVTHDDATGEQSSTVSASVSCRVHPPIPVRGQPWVEAEVTLAGTTIVDESNGVPSLPCLLEPPPE